MGNPHPLGTIAHDAYCVNQVLEHMTGPERVVLLDHDETHLHDVAAELDDVAVQVLADIRNLAQLRAVFGQVGLNNAQDVDFVCSGSCDYLQGAAFAFVAGVDALGAVPPINAILPSNIDGSSTVPLMTSPTET